MSKPQALIPFDNTYVKLPEYFYKSQVPQPVKQAELIRFNTALAQELELDSTQLAGQTGADIFAGNVVPAGAAPIAMAYSGHQFGNFAPWLGDGRVVQLGEMLSPAGERFDIQLKGSGRTPWSRGGDGRAALGPILREYIMCEFMHRVGIPTTRALAAVTTGETVVREQLLPGAIITRLATSYVRVGTFQFFAARGKNEAVRELADYTIQRNYSGLSEAENPYLALLAAVGIRQANLVARWMQIGFIHGVMNTDNMSIAGETIDYGPCAFMDTFRFDQVYSSIDRQGRYAYQNQPSIAHWNLCRLAETLLPLLGDDEEAGVEMVQEVINQFPEQYYAAWLDGMRVKLGLTTEQEGDRELAQDLLKTMERHQADFTLTFRRLSELSAQADTSVAQSADQSWLSLFTEAAEPQQWLERWRARLQAEAAVNSGFDDEQRQNAMRAANPLYIPRNHLVEECIRAAEDAGDFAPFEQLLAVLEQPFTEQAGQDKYTLPPEPEQVVHRTFCGT